MSYTFEEIDSIISAFGFPYNYFEFSENEVPEGTYVLFYYPQRSDLMADNRNYSLIQQLNIELYTNEKDFTAESAVESVLIAHDLPFSKEETYLESENMYEVLYITEVYLNA